jgi:hypothetical protein
MRALPHVAGFPDLGVLRPARTAARPPKPLPGLPVIGRAFASLARGRSGPRRLSRVPTTTIRTFNAHYAGRFLSARSWNQDAPDSHRQAVMNLSLLRHVVLHFLTTPEQSRRTAAKQSSRPPRFRRSLHLTGVGAGIGLLVPCRCLAPVNRARDARGPGCCARHGFRFVPAEHAWPNRHLQPLRSQAEQFPQGRASSSRSSSARTDVQGFGRARH